MKLCFFIESLSHGAGTERITVDVANSLVSRGYDVYFIILSENTKSFYLLDKRIIVKSISSKFSEKLKSIIRLRKELKEDRPDYLINVAFQMSVISLFACLALKIKVVTWDHFYLKSGSFIGYIVRLISALFSYKQIVLTMDDLNAYPEFLHKKIICIPNFTSLNSTPTSGSKSKIVLSVGRLNYAKGFDLLIKSWRIVANEFPDWKLIIIGEGTEEKKLRDLINTLNLTEKIEICPVTSNILEFYLKSSIYAMSSRFEPFGLVLIEAKSCSLPVVAFNCPYGPKGIIRNGIDGFLIDNLDIDNFAQKILYLIEHKYERNEMGKLAFSDYLERWSKDSIMKKWYEIF